VTIFDERAELGGMMRYGIPGFRTPRPVLDAEIQRILDLGVTARMNTRIGTDITLADPEPDFDAVFLGLGAQSGRPLPVEGADAPNVVTATAFLKAFNDGRMQHVGKRVVVVGGGDTSIDVATVARRLGHIDQVHEADRPENAIAAGRLCRARRRAAVAPPGCRGDADLDLPDREDAGQQARGGARGGRRHRHPRWHGPGGRAARARRPRHRRCA
jgi:NADPH-dependent glutamate synthase beta subunit-like oxidoreductase